jgi:hypothetical protein
MLLIAVGLIVALVAVDILELQSRRSSRRDSRLLDRTGLR